MPSWTSQNFVLSIVLFVIPYISVSPPAHFRSQSEVQEESGWKLVHGDVFRPPAWGMLLCVLLGSGSQLFLMVLVTLFFACLGFLSPANRGSLMTCALAMYACSGILAGN